MSMSEDNVLIEAIHLKKYFPIRGGLLNRSQASVKAVDDVSIRINKGETVGLVGESGCGKTTAGRAMLMLTKPTGGNIYYKMPTNVRQRMLQLEEMEGELLSKVKTKADLVKKVPEKAGELEELESIRAKYALNYKKGEDLRRMRSEMQIVFQDPYSSLNPRMLIRDVVGEPLLVHGRARGDELVEQATYLLEKVGLSEDHLYRFPHEFSGGQRQRIGVARALALNPDMIVLDEPTSALDVSGQGQILNLLNDLQRDLGLTYLFISHDLSTIRYMCDRVNVMYLGKIVESGNKTDIFDNPMHPYTDALLSVIPIPDPEVKRKTNILSGDVPSPANPPKGCRFHTRCRHRQEICEEKEPPLEDRGNGHLVACHFAEDLWRARGR